MTKPTDDEVVALLDWVVDEMTKLQRHWQAPPGSRWGRLLAAATALRARMKSAA